MPTYRITTPDGKTFNVTGDGSQDEALAHFQSQYSAQRKEQANPAEYDPDSPAYQAKYGATSGSSFLQNTREGFGQSLVNLVRGAGQAVGLVSRNDVAQSRALDAPLLQTWGGKIGSIAGNIAATIPAMAIPGAGTIPGAAAVGAGLGFLQPSTSTKETVLNTGIGGAMGAAGQYLGNKIAGAAEGRLAAREAAAADEASLNSARDAVLAQSRQAGYVVPPTAINPNLANTALESVAGKAATRQGAEAINARVTNGLIKGDLGIPANQPITREALEKIRDTAGKIYGAIKSTGTVAADQEYLGELGRLANTGADLEGAFPGIGAQANAQVKELMTSLAQPQFDANSAVETYKFLINRAKAGFQAGFGKNGNPQALELARAQRGAADALGELIERHLASSGNQALADSWQTARTTIAKAYTAEGALRGGNISAKLLANQLQRNKPLSGGFKMAAEFGDMFGDVARLPKSGVGVSKLQAIMGGAEGTTAAFALAHGNIPLAIGAAGAAAAPPLTRAGILSSMGQRALATPNYAPNALGTLGLGALEGAGRYGTLPAGLGVYRLAQAQQQDPTQP